MIDILEYNPPYVQSGSDGTGKEHTKVHAVTCARQNQNGLYLQKA